ncbi:unnamed protein product [Gemmata massiliana]|uniref:Uncharacterized protein n=1 Tax=Gemmata massiliana TaxID=1210884 RepID=A0A6P2D6F7_9BACT|nr:hypothetical protein [Gemmata massiliana]VTR96507.1 unnamed protein product [Gemmata massiliana]
MLFAVYAEIGDGVLYLTLGCAASVGMLSWITYWLARGFRAPGPAAPPGRLAVWVVGCSVAVAAVCLPPLRKAGDWRAEPRGEPVAPASAGQLDLDYFGCIPRFAWAGTVGAEEALVPGASCQSRAGVRGRCERYRWVVDGPHVAAEVMCFGLLILPFARARAIRRARVVEPGAAPDTAR